MKYLVLLRYYPEEVRRAAAGAPYDTTLGKVRPNDAAADLVDAPRTEDGFCVVGELNRQLAVLLGKDLNDAVWGMLAPDAAEWNDEPDEDLVGLVAEAPEPEQVPAILKALTVDVNESDIPAIVTAARDLENAFDERRLPDLYEALGVARPAA